MSSTPNSTILANGSKIMEEDYLVENIITFSLIYYPIIIIIGICGNMISICVFRFTKLKHLPSSHYLSALAVVDTIVLASLSTSLIEFFREIILYKNGPCQAVHYILAVSSCLSVWYVVCFTVERYIAVCYPLKRLVWCTVRRARITILLAAFFPIVFYAHVPFTIIFKKPVANNSATCGADKEIIFVIQILNLIDVVLTLLIPMAVIIVLNVLIVRQMSEAKKKFTPSRPASYTQAHQNNSLHLPNNGHHHDNDHQTPRLTRNTHHQKDDRNVTKMLLTVSAVFIIMNLPDHFVRTFQIYVYWSSIVRGPHVFSPNQERISFIVHQITNLLFRTSFSLNFFLYTFVGANFRKYLKKLCLKVARLLCRRAYDKVYNRMDRRNTRNTTIKNTPLNSVKSCSQNKKHDDKTVPLLDVQAKSEIICIRGQHGGSKSDFGVVSSSAPENKGEWV